VRERQREGWIANQHRTGCAPAYFNGPDRQAMQRAADLHLDNVAAFAAAFDEVFGAA
jgi:hypothetical protein